MPTYTNANEQLTELANSILNQFESHKPLLDAEVKIDFIFAYADRDDTGLKKNCAIRHHGVSCAGLAKIVKLKDRAMGRGDGEITIDHDWWSDPSTSDAMQRAVLDHELHHFAVSTDEHGEVKRDDLDRPKLIMRCHDYDQGHFVAIAERHGAASQECIQIKRMMEDSGQYLMPGVFAPKEVATESTPEPVIA